MIVGVLKYLVSQAYGGIQALRAGIYAKGFCTARKLPCKVVCVGNLTAGGTGKTPMIMFLARLLQAHKISTVILSRGYKGALEQTGGLASNREKVLLTARDAGDEPYLLACRLKGVPVYVGRDRFANGLKALKAFTPAVILLDDGYQHLQLQRDINLLLMDAARPLDNGHVIPRGMLREKPQALNRSQAVVFTRGHQGQDSFEVLAPFIAPGNSLPHFVSGHKVYCYLVPKASDLAAAFVNVTEFCEPATLFANQPRKIMAFSGIAKNQSFLNTLAAAGLEVAGQHFYDDHHAYTAADLAELQQRAVELNVDLLATTEKDHAKLQGCLNFDLAVFGVKIDFFGRESSFADYFFKALDLPDNFQS